MKSRSIINKTFMLAGLSMLPFSASAFDYNFIQATFVDTDFDSGFNIEGSYDIRPDTSVIGSVLLAGDYTFLSLGGSRRLDFDLNEDMSLEVQAALERASFDSEFCFGSFSGLVCNSVSSSDTGFSIGGLLRYDVQQDIEVFGGLAYSTLGDGDIVLNFGGMYNFSENLHAYGRMRLSDNDTIEVGVRYVFE